VCLPGRGVCERIGSSSWSNFWPWLGATGE